MGLINNPKYIIVHSSASPQRGDTARDVHSWHLEKGWDGIGYHFTVSDDGMVEVGRPWYWSGAHCPEYNNNSIGVMRFGNSKEDFNEQQKDGLLSLVKGLMTQFNIPKENVLGHYETKSGAKQGKTCPDIDMEWFRTLL